MRNFIILTDKDGDLIRINVANISHYGGFSVVGAAKTWMILSSQPLVERHFKESADEIDVLIDAAMGGV